MSGTDKAFAQLGGATLLERAMTRLGPQVDAVWINSPAPAASSFGLPVVTDATADFDGPLAGILAGLDMASQSGVDRMASVAVDTPFFPLDVVSRLAAVDPTRIAVARSDGRLHPVFALWPVLAREPLREFFATGETRKVMTFIESFGFEPVDFDLTDIDPFFNINTADDLVEAERRLMVDSR